MPGDLRPPVQPARRGEVELVRIAAHFQEDRGEPAQSGGFLRDPQGVGELLHIRNEQVARRQPAESEKPRRIGKTRLAEGFARADPQYGGGAPCMTFAGKPGQRQRKAGGGACVAGVGAVDFGQRGLRQPAAECRVETRRSCPQPRREPGFGGKAGLTQDHAIGHGRHDRTARSGRGIEPLGESAFDPGDFPAQGQNSFPRHGGGRHVGCFRSVPVMF